MDIFERRNKRVQQKPQVQEHVKGKNNIVSYFRENVKYKNSIYAVNIVKHKNDKERKQHILKCNYKTS